ncbi:hypothetical protein [Paenibacillus sp. N3.4]|uniref:hypothetical protein n=1 Tax=Paenibacillus sp. N3.4 TaxID=2603222 RepID=UPI0011C928FD|nr:hypothetical protein [Paenibacillus sp. N3.4]TXK77656.1 hypothetical protein FU659_22185 [Paenibacillus sp. N3.4]
MTTKGDERYERQHEEKYRIGSGDGVGSWNRSCWLQQIKVEGSGSTVSPTKAGASPSAPEKRGKIKISLYDRGNTPAAEGSITNNRWTKWINENGPADVEFVPVPRFESKQSLIRCLLPEMPLT